MRVVGLRIFGPHFFTAFRGGAGRGIGVAGGFGQKRKKRYAGSKKNMVAAPSWLQSAKRDGRQRHGVKNSWHQQLKTMATLLLPLYKTRHPPSGIPVHHIPRNERRKACSKRSRK